MAGRNATREEAHNALNSTRHTDPTRFLLERGVIDSDEFAFLKAPILTEAQREREKLINQRVTAWRLAEYQRMMGQAPDAPAPSRPASKRNLDSRYTYED